MKGLILLLLALPCLTFGQTTYDKTQDKKDGAQDATISIIQKDITTLYGQNASYKTQLVDAQKLIVSLQAAVKALQKQDSIFQVAQDDDHDIAVDALLEANRKDTLKQGDGIVIDPVKKTISVLNYAKLTAPVVAVPASADITDLTNKLAAALIRIATLEGINTKLKSQYP